MNRNGIGSLIRNGPSPGRAGLSHLGSQEMVIPNAAMQASPGLRQRAMQTMARMGRNPQQYVMGSGRNSVNPRTGQPEFADMVYTENGWVDPNTGAPVDFSQSSDNYANTGTSDPNAWQSPAAGSSKSYNGATSAYFDTGRGQEAPPPTYMAPEPGTPKVYNPSPVYQPPSMGTPKFYPPADGTPKQYNPVDTSSPFQPAVNAAVEQQASPPYSPDFGAWSAPQTYDQWRDTRNPAGKGVPNTLFGQASEAGAASPFTTPSQMGDIGQMPVGTPNPWSIPGTALGYASENGSNNPSILNNGYQNSMSPGISGAAGYNPLAGLFGGNPNGGISFSGAGTGGGAYGQQQNAPPPGFVSSFRY